MLHLNLRQVRSPEIGLGFVILSATSFLGIQTASGQGSNQVRSPAEDPPAVTVDPAPTQSLPAQTGQSLGAPTAEWKLHKTADGAHPDGREQQVMWLMNRARANPSAEGFWLATSTDPDVAGGRSFFGVNRAMLQSEFNGYSVKPPAAFDARLYNAAKAHSDDLIARDAQDHIGQFARVAAAGYKYLAARGNVFAYADSSLNAHAAWNMDWGGTEGGMQTGRGHRKAIMSLDGDYTNVYKPLLGTFLNSLNYITIRILRLLVGIEWSLPRIGPSTGALYVVAVCPLNNRGLNPPRPG